ncbi:MAG: hypothetical protein ABIM17_00855 [candidate division WOR-3 bacterium]
MRKVITMVGAYLFKNFFQHNKEKAPLNNYEAPKKGEKKTTRTKSQELQG